MLKTMTVRATIAAILAGLSMSVYAIADTQRIDIPAGSLLIALETLAKQANVDLVYQDAQVQGLRTGGVVGDLSPHDAVVKLLQGTPLKVRTDEASGAILIMVPASTPTTSPLSAAPSPPSGEGRGEETKPSFWSRLRLAQADARSPSQGEGQGEVTAGEGGAESQPQKRVEVEEVVVTGTNIRGIHPQSSPLEIYTADDIERMGATTTAQFVERLPQNLGTRSLSGTSAVRSGGGSTNQEAIAAVDLRGLGLGTTLVLLNGRRLGLSDFGRTVDVSVIPMSAVERVEVLTDGASAIYGSDAVGGVVNFVLRKDFEGVQTHLSYGAATEGGMRQFNTVQTFGGNWGSGSGLLSYDYFDASALSVADRDYAARADAGNLTPDLRRHSLLATVSQRLGERLTVNGDAAFSRRDMTDVTAAVFSSNPLNWLLSDSSKDTDQYFANLALDYRITSDLRASLATTASETEYSSQGVHTYYNRTPPALQGTTNSVKKHSVRDLTAVLDGALFALPGGAIRFSLGVGFTDEKYSGAAISVSAIPDRTLGRVTEYAFGELFLPIVGADQGLPFVHRLELNVAGRYTNYSDKSRPELQHRFGEETDPKAGLLWAPTKSLRFRGTYGTSFRAASLSELDETGASNQFIPGVPIPLPAGTPSTLFFVFNLPTPNLKPEAAETYTVGFDFRPEWMPGLRVSGTYYDISYTDRIGTAPEGGSGYLFTPAQFPLAIYRPPSAAFIEQIIRNTQNVGGPPPGGVDLSDPAAAAQLLFDSGEVWVVDRRFRNLSLSEQNGFDLTVDNTFAADWGELRYGMNITRIMSYLEQGAPGTPVISVVDTLTKPVEFRGRAYVGLSRGGFGATLNVNYMDDYHAPFAGTGAAASHIASWTTADLILSYAFDDAESVLRDGVRLSLTVQNLFDRDPPFVMGGSTSLVETPIGYDPVNANPLGRFLSMGITKAW